MKDTFEGDMKLEKKLIGGMLFNLRNSNTQKLKCPKNLRASAIVVWLCDKTPRF